MTLSGVPLPNVDLSAFDARQIKAIQELMLWIKQNDDSVLNAAVQTIPATAWASPGTIGSTMPNTGVFTTLQANRLLTALAGLTLTGALTLNTGVVTPANGQIGAGDAAWIVVGSGTPGPPPAPAFQNGFTNRGGVQETTQFRTIPGGMVVLNLQVTGGAPGTTAFQLPARYRPAGSIVVPDAGGVGFIAVLGTGEVQPSVALAQQYFSFYAEQ